MIFCLIGVFFGYVGYEDVGQFMEVVRRKFYVVFFFDEFEKVYCDILVLFF